MVHVCRDSPEGPRLPKRGLFFSGLCSPIRMPEKNQFYSPDLGGVSIFVGPIFWHLKGIRNKTAAFWGSTLSSHAHCAPIPPSKPRKAPEPVLGLAARLARERVMLPLLK